MQPGPSDQASNILPDLGEVSEEELLELLQKQDMLSRCVSCYNKSWNLIGNRSTARLAVVVYNEDTLTEGEPIRISGGAAVVNLAPVMALACNICGYLRFFSAHAFAKLLTYVRDEKKKL